MKFVKMHGLGNDFVFLEDKNGADKDFSQLAVKMCAPHTGIGADGIIVIVPSDKADVRMRIINADGSEAEMCGNGIRCFAKYVYDNGIIDKKEFAVETLAGIMKPKVTVGDDGKVSLVTINMGKPFTDRAQIPMEGPSGPVIDEPIEIDGKTYPLFKLDTSSESHPFYTGAQTRIVEAGRVEKFRAKFAAKNQELNAAAAKAKAK